MIKTVAHISDVHIRKSPQRNEEYEEVFENLYKSLRKQNPCRIVIVGDIVDKYLDLQPEQIILTHTFLKTLASIAPVRITRGNHDFSRKSKNRVDSIEAIIKTIDSPNLDIIYYNKTGFYNDDNVVWCVWHHGEEKNNPWVRKEGKKLKKEDGLTYVDLFHDPINGCRMDSGIEANSKQYYSINDFRGCILMAGDIHLQQYLSKDKTKAYSGSLIAQTFAEGDDKFHGYLLWDIETKTSQQTPIYNNYSFKNIDISQFIDFDDLDFEIEDPTKYMKVRFIWKTLPQTRTNERERILSNYIKTKYFDSEITIYHKNEFIESEKIESSPSLTLSNINEKTVQHEIFTEYLDRIGTESSMINDILTLDDEIENYVEIFDDFGVEWDILKFGAKNFMSYEEFDIDWRDNYGLFQLLGVNTGGKTTIFKVITYILFGKTLETEMREKHGDSRFVNNRNGSMSCSGYMVISAMGNYYGIKRTTKLSKSRDGEINGASTSVEYYLLTTPDDDFDDTQNVESLNESERNLTLNKIQSIVGSYDNFMRIVMTTSDILNNVLSSNPSVFIDSLLYDSGLDIFDKKLEGFKKYQKKLNEKPRINCDVEHTNEKNKKLTDEINLISNDIDHINKNILPDIQTRIKKGEDFIEGLIKKLHKIDDDIYNLNLSDLEGEIKIHRNNITDINQHKNLIETNINGLKKSYDENKLTELTEKRENHKTREYELRLKIKEIQQNIREEEHAIEILNGNVFQLKKEGKECKEEMSKLEKSDTCPTCGRKLDDNDLHIIDDNIAKIKKKMFGIADQIKDIDDNKKRVHQLQIESLHAEVGNIKHEIDILTENMNVVLDEIGVLTNDKNEVEKRKELLLSLEQYPIKIQNEELKISVLEQKRINYNNNLKNIEENKGIEKNINAAKLRLNELKENENEQRTNILNKNNLISIKKDEIVNNNKLIDDFKKQEYQDMIMALYKKCVHRDGIPKQLLQNHIVPKINTTIEKILTSSKFKIYLDEDELKPKLIYHDRPEAVINCVSGSGKERTFSAITLKLAYNQINAKSKPTIFILDEIMGKLLGDSVDEFIDLLHEMKIYVKKILIVEHNADLEPDHTIRVELDEDGISSLTLD